MTRRFAIVADRTSYRLRSRPCSSDAGVMRAPRGEPEWDEFGERIIATAICMHCGEDLDLVEVYLEPEIVIRRPVALWKHERDGAVGCGPGQTATPMDGSERPKA